MSLLLFVHFNVRPSLVEYNSVVWSPYRKCDIVAVENVQVQRRFTKRLPGFAEHSYSKRVSLRLSCLVWNYVGAF